VQLGQQDELSLGRRGAVDLFEVCLEVGGGVVAATGLNQGDAQLLI
jgi:hypothetical protein